MRGNLEFWQALRALKTGKKIGRAAWEEYKFLCLMPASNQKAVAGELREEFPDNIIPHPAYIAYVHAAEPIVQPWCPTHSDILSNDWYIK